MCQRPRFPQRDANRLAAEGQSTFDTGLVIGPEPGAELGLGVGVSSGVGVAVVLDFG